MAESASTEFLEKLENQLPKYDEIGVSLLYSEVQGELKKRQQKQREEEAKQRKLDDQQRRREEREAKDNATLHKRLALVFKHSISELQDIITKADLQTEFGQLACKATPDDLVEFFHPGWFVMSDEKFEELFS